MLSEPKAPAILASPWWPKLIEGGMAALASSRSPFAEALDYILPSALCSQQLPFAIARGAREAVPGGFGQAAAEPMHATRWQVLPGKGALDWTAHSHGCSGICSQTNLTCIDCSVNRAERMNARGTFLVMFMAFFYLGKATKANKFLALSMDLYYNR